MQDILQMENSGTNLKEILVAENVQVPRQVHMSLPVICVSTLSPFANPHLENYTPFQSQMHLGTLQVLTL